jgi:hypothetical protein
MSWTGGSVVVLQEFTQSSECTAREKRLVDGYPTWRKRWDSNEMPHCRANQEILTST